MSSCGGGGQANPVPARFCLACGAPLPVGRAAREERKVVTAVAAAHLARALAFYRSVGARSLTGEAEALLATSA